MTKLRFRKKVSSFLTKPKGLKTFSKIKLTSILKKRSTEKGCTADLHAHEVLIRHCYHKRHRRMLETKCIKQELKLPAFSYSGKLFDNTERHIYELFVRGFYNSTRHRTKSMQPELLVEKYKKLNDIEKRKYKFASNNRFNDELWSSDPYLIFLNDYITKKKKYDNVDSFMTEKIDKIRYEARKKWFKMNSFKKEKYIEKANMYSNFPRELDLSLVQEEFFVSNHNFKETYS